MASKTEQAEATLSLEQRIERAEAAIAAIALRLTANYPFRGPGHGIDCAREIVAEYEAAEEAFQRSTAINQKRAELAELEGAA